MDDEDCKFEKQQKKLLGEGKKINDPYVEIIPQLKTLDDFLKANAHAQSREKALVVKFYSRQCRACLRIAAKYRRLALEKRDEIDCYEVESLASRPLVDGLNVTKVPSVQIYDPDGVTRLADGPCMPDDFPRCVVGGLCFDFEPIRTASVISWRVTRRWRRHETS